MKKKYLVVLTLAMIIPIVVLILGCAPKTSTPTNTADDTNDGDVAVAINWTPTSDCATCHRTEEDSLSDNMTTAGFHKTEGLDCSSCHGDVAGLEKAHDGVTTADTTAKRLKQTTVGNAVCSASGCHDDEAVRVAATAEFTGLKDENGTVVNPHALPEGSGHEKINCSTCHLGHEAFEAEKVKNSCISCHHEDVFECYTCHP